jgi:hypothetical protein
MEIYTFSVELIDKISGKNNEGKLGFSHQR